jgi:hypothetical protein
MLFFIGKGSLNTTYNFVYLNKYFKQREYVSAEWTRKLNIDVS